MEYMHTWVLFVNQLTYKMTSLKNTTDPKLVQILFTHQTDFKPLNQIQTHHQITILIKKNV